jgi:hypothetical protein
MRFSEFCLWTCAALDVSVSSRWYRSATHSSSKSQAVLSSPSSTPAAIALRGRLVFLLYCHQSSEFACFDALETYFSSKSPASACDAVRGLHARASVAAAAVHLCRLSANITSLTIGLDAVRQTLSATTISR